LSFTNVKGRFPEEASPIKYNCYQNFSNYHFEKEIFNNFTFLECHYSNLKNPVSSGRDVALQRLYSTENQLFQRQKPGFFWLAQRNISLSSNRNRVFTPSYMNNVPAL
jgi:hypothetical protein